MRKARRLIEESIAAHDVVIEVLDARMPRSSENPDVAAIRRHKPALKVLAKSDLADPTVTKKWLEHYESQPKVAALAIQKGKEGETRRRIPELCRKLCPNRAGKMVRAMVLGIPNVGKSTVINILAARKVANVGDKPAVTKGKQLIELDDMILSDTPGILWPRIDPEEKTGMKLAFGGAINDTAIDLEPVALFGAEFLLKKYPDAIKARYKLDVLPESADELIVEIGRRRGGLKPGGIVDREKAASVFIHDFRSGALGRISLELPPRS
jgi:ribosome biogenesis GTPase A